MKRPGNLKIVPERCSVLFPNFPYKLSTVQNLIENETTRSKVKATDMESSYDILKYDHLMCNVVLEETPFSLVNTCDTFCVLKRPVYS